MANIILGFPLGLFADRFIGGGRGATTDSKGCKRPELVVGLKLASDTTGLSVLVPKVKFRLTSRVPVEVADKNM